MPDQIIPVEIATINSKTISFRRLGRGKRKILFFHGFPGSSLQLASFHKFVDDLDLEVICVDRPGYNKSECVEGNQFHQASEAAFKLLISLGWSRCQVISVSGGTPFLFSFVKTYPKFVSKVDVVCGLGPIGTPGFKKFMTFKASLALKLLPYLPGSIFSAVLPKESAEKKPNTNLIRYFLPASPADVQSIQSVETQNILAKALSEAFLQKGIGPKRDAKVYLSAWNFELNGYGGPVDIWHGDQDLILPPEMAQQTARAIPHATLHMIQGEGHYSLPINQLGTVLRN